MLGYARIAKKYGLTGKHIERVVGLLKKVCVVMYPVSLPDVVKSDPDDSHILAIAAEAKADRIVSGDRHLLDLEVWQGVPVVTARRFGDEVVKSQ